MTAGANVARIGIVAALTVGGWVWLWSLPVFVGFGMMFGKVMKKNSLRIDQMDGEKASWYKFLDGKGYAVIVFMMSLGIGLRMSGRLPEGFFAFFYTGLGSALFIAGLQTILQHFNKKQ